LCLYFASLLSPVLPLGPEFKTVLFYRVYEAVIDQQPTAWFSVEMK
jgi:hypothetical protein